MNAETITRIVTDWKRYAKTAENLMDKERWGESEYYSFMANAIYIGTSHSNILELREAFSNVTID